MITPRRAARRLFAAALIALAVAAGCGDLRRFAYAGFGGRDSWQHPDRVVESLEIQPGDQVADLGSGGGYFTFRLADAVGGTGRVYAVDVDPEMNEHLRAEVAEKDYANVDVILAEYADPRLPETGVDLIFSANTYHHLQDRSKYFANARRYLQPGGRVAVIDFSPDSWLNRLFGHATDADVIRSEMIAAGYRLERELDFLPRQHFMVFAVE
ncbi:MAG: class I SAM-dependent methyltransferase [Deltaproteobacteria bacterium]|nr:MAG: class I SAM-dependent methyltransferase [Deltaproteobacteria bacterium]